MPAQNKSRLLVSSASPRVAGLRGTLRIEPIDARAAGELLYARSRDYESLITYEETCDVLAVLAGLSHFHRKRVTEEVPIALRDGDQTLVVTIADAARRKDRRSLGAFDFDFTLCTFEASSDAAPRATR